MKSVQRLDLTLEGISGDANARADSPRQVLLASYEVLCRFDLEMGSLRENIVISYLDLHALPSGTFLGLGKAVLHLTFHCETCVKLRGLPISSPAALNGQRGYLASVVEPGTVSIGEVVVPMGQQRPAMPHRMQARVEWVLRQVPAGQVIRYDELLHQAGLSRTYLRSLPGMLKRAAPGVPVHRVVDTRGQLIRHIPDQAGLLAAESVIAVGPPETKEISSR